MGKGTNQTAEETVTFLEDGNVASPQGFSAGGLHCGIRKSKLDLGWVYSDIPAAAAGVYTTNAFQAAPLKVTKESIEVENKLQGVLVNSGIANSCTGSQGLADAYSMREVFAEKIGIEKHLAAVVSTGLIGAMLPMDKIKQGIDGLDEQENKGAERFNTAILTTDTKEKTCGAELEIDGKTITIGGAAKGSGMIHPNMATMLSFLTTDAAVEPAALSHALKQITNQSFNMITVDGDTSTNDMVLLLANGKAANNELNQDHPDWNRFVDALATVSEKLAKEIARDGEGATKLVEVHVTGAKTEEAARAVSKSIISSNLVKTAIHGADANWGRIVTAIGYSKETVEPDKVSVSLGNIPVVKGGIPLEFDEEKAKQYLEKDEIIIEANLGNGTEKATAWGCDLSYEYVRINASYRT